ncbi:MAG TPA: dihydrofolate reductase [Amycolatopsis sp.]|nr:dihydrofolate reductase [Amycolatopsis sp.]
MGMTYLHAVASLDGFIADEHDDVGPLHEWYFAGDHPLAFTDDPDYAEAHGGAPFRVSAASADYVRGLWERQRVLVIGRHQFDLTDGWSGHPPAGGHVVVVSHRPRPVGWHPEAPYHFAGSVEAGLARARELAGDGDIGIGAGDVGGQALELGLVDHVAMDVVPVVFGRGKRYFGAFADATRLLGDPDVVVRGAGVLHLRFPVRR